MKVICVILCLIISTTVYTGSISTTAYAGSILWSSKHSSTSLEKDQEWLALLAEETIVTKPLLMVQTREEPEIENPAPTEEPQDFLETMEETAEDVSTEPIAPFVEGIEDIPTIPTSDEMDSITLDEIQEYAAPEDGVDEVEDVDEPRNMTGENQNEQYFKRTEAHTGHVVPITTQNESDRLDCRDHSSGWSCRLRGERTLQHSA